jgi:endonuclease/exonuclease/phosphatase family metal-dependent hydrolase
MQPRTIRIATLNLWGRFADWPRRRDRLARQLPALEIDVYLLQEVVCGDGKGDQLRDVAELLGYEWTARVVAEQREHETEEEGVAIVSRHPLTDVAVFPLPPSHPPRHRLEATVESVRVLTFHAAVSPDEHRDEQIAGLASLHDSPLLVGSDLNAPPSIVRPLVGDLDDTLGWDDAPTWPRDEEEFVRAWTEKLGEPPDGDVDPRRLDYLLARGLDVHNGGTVATASDHLLVWADVTARTGRSTR